MHCRGVMSSRGRRSCILSESPRFETADRSPAMPAVSTGVRCRSRAASTPWTQWRLALLALLFPLRLGFVAELIFKPLQHEHPPDGDCSQRTRSRMVESISRLDLRYRFGLIAAGDFSPPAGSRYHGAGAAGKSLSPRVREARSLVNSCRLMKLQWQSLV